MCVLFCFASGMNTLIGYDLVPEPKILEAALRACRRLDDLASAIRILEAVKVIKSLWTTAVAFFTLFLKAAFNMVLIQVNNKKVFFFNLRRTNLAHTKRSTPSLSKSCSPHSVSLGSLHLRNLALTKHRCLRLWWVLAYRIYWFSKQAQDVSLFDLTFIVSFLFTYSLPEDCGSCLDWIDHCTWSLCLVSWCLCYI